MAGIDITCYDNIIGLARRQCPCLDAAPDNTFNTSNSGLFLGDLSPLGDLEGFDDCGTGSIWDVLDASRDRAIRTFVSDTNSLLISAHNVPRKPWTGGVGRAEKRGQDTSTELYTGARLAMAPIRGAFFRVTRMGGIFDTGGNLTITVYDKHNVVRKTFTISVNAGAHTEVVLPTGDIFELPLFDEYLDQAEYFFTYERAAAPGVAQKNRVTCACGSAFRGSFNCSHPYYNNGNNFQRYGNTYGWTDWFLAGGWTGNTVTDFDDAPTNAPNELHGLTIFGEVRCENGEVLCKDSINFLSNPLAMSMAHAIQYKGGEYAAMDVLGSSKITRPQMISREVLIQNQGIWRSKYNEHVNYIVAEADISANDCLSCKSVVEMQNQGVFS